ncbi:GNAT family N-acetyltransferase [Eubacterium xylanophilum]|uniref:GNAT family N-acetyltransferase n=1 Tax=Eubacterium xylanophilum TaxID=39497 RepID=UPI00047D08C9|nr:GNAT family N-acetyltransferase [Eubacterium xylanophilum]
MNGLGTKKLETERLILRKFEVSDASDMYNNWAGDPLVSEFLTWPYHTDIEVTKKILAIWEKKYSDKFYMNWAIVEKSTNNVIGSIGVVDFKESVKSAEIGYALSRMYWGRGIMPEALKRVMDFLFDDVGFNRVAACHDTDNPKSGRVMEKVGMIREGVLRQSRVNNRGITDVMWYSTIRSDR